MSLQKTKSKTLDLNKVKQIIFDDIDPLLEYLGLEYEQVADNIFMRCPIHEGSDNKQGLSISLTKQTWRCWTRGCQEDYSTDIFGFIRGVLYARDENHGFSDALRLICKVYNVNNAKKNSTGEKTKKTDDPFANVVKVFKKKQETESSDIDFATVKTCGCSPYFEARGFNRSTLSNFGVEDCDDKSSSMRLRSIIPIFFDRSQVGFIARATRDWIQPKYLFSEGLRKTDYLYNYDGAIEEAKQKHCIFLVEGQGDVWRLYEAGVKNAMGLFGKDISSTQKRLLLNSGVTTLVVLTDNDQAGRESKIKINRELGRLFNLVFPATHGKDLGDTSVEKIRKDILTNLKGHY